MKRCKPILAALGLLALVIGTPVMASTTTGATHKGQVNVINTSYASANNTVPFTLNTQNMIDNKYLNSACTNVALTDLGGVDVPFMPAPAAGTAWMMFEDDILQNATNSYYLYTGGGAMSGKIRYFPAAGGMTVVDSATLEPASAFQYELKGYFNTSVGSNKDLLLKSNALRFYVSAADTLKVELANAAATASYTGGTNTSSFYIYAANWSAQTFPVPAYNCVGGIVSLDLLKYGAPTGTLTVGLYATSSNLPTGSALGTATMDVSTLTTSSVWYNFYISSSTLTASTTYAIVVSCSGGDASNYVHWRYLNSDGYATYRQCTSTNSGSSWAGETRDRNFNFYPIVGCTATLASKETTIKLTGDGTNLKIYDGVSEIGTGGQQSLSVINNATNWSYVTNGVMPYVEYIKATVGGTLKGHWYWENAATFTDQSGNSNTGTPTFRTTTTDADVSASLTTFAPVAPSSGGVTSTATITGPITTIPADPVVTDVVPHNMTNIPFIGTPISDYLVDNDIPEGLFTYPFMMVIIALVIFVVFHFTRDIGWAGIAQFVISGLFIAWRLLPWPALFFFGVVLAFTIIKRRTIST